MLNSANVSFTTSSWVALTEVRNSEIVQRSLSDEDRIGCKILMLKE